MKFITRLNKTIFFLAFFLTFVVTNTFNASATVVSAWSLDPVSAFRNASWSFGQKFTVGSDDINVTGIGAFDAGQDGFISTGGIPVGIFRESDGSLLASTNVVSSDTLDGGFRFADIATLLLDANTEYRVVAVNLDDLYNGLTLNWLVDSAITLGNYGYCNTTVLTSCDNFTGNNLIWMANFRFEIAAIIDVPEPAPILLMVFGLLFGWKIRSKKA